MRIYFRTIIIAVLATILTSCQLNVEPETVNEEDAVIEKCLVHKSFTIGDEPQTRATLDSEMKTKWELNDEFSIYDPIAKKGQKFKVTQVTDSYAVVEGTISEGNFNISAVFPYSAVSWNSDGTWTISVSKSQKPQNYRKVERNALVCGVKDANPSGIIQMEALTSLVKFNIDRKDIASVSLRLCTEKGGGFVNYTLSPKDSTAFRQKTYYLSVETGEYPGGAKVVYTTKSGKTIGQSSGTSLTLETGKFTGLGKASAAEDVVPYSLEQTHTFTNMSDYLDQMAQTHSDMADYQEYIDIVLSDFFTSEQKQVAVNSYIMEYESSDPNGSPVTLTARIYIPQPGLNGKELKSALIYNRQELGRNNDSPTNAYNAECVAAWLGDGSAMYIPDYYGMGCNASRSTPQSFIDSPFTAEGVIDGLRAYLQVLKDFSVNYGDRIYNGGYGQGGAVAMANLRHVALHPELGLHINKTFAGGGFYNYKNCYDAIISYEKIQKNLFTKWYKYEKYEDGVPYFVYGVAYLNKCQGLGLNLANVFKKDMYDQLDERVYKKKYSLKYVTDIGINDDNRNLFTDLLADGTISQSSNEAKALIDAMDYYNLCKGWSVPSGSEVYLYHYEDDEIFPYSNYEEMKNFLGSGSNIHYFSRSDLVNTQKYYSIYKLAIAVVGENHKFAAAPFCFWTFESLF